MKFTLILLLLSALASVFGQGFVQGEVLVKFREGQERTGEAITRSIGGVYVGGVPGIGVRQVRLPSIVPVSLALQIYSQLPFVEFAEPNFVARKAAVPNDPHYGNQWALPKVNAPQAWDLSTGSSNVVIAIIDTGIQLNHPDLQSKLVPGWDFVNNDNIPDDDEGHGTHCAGIAAAATNNSTGIAGLGWNCSLMPVKVLDQAGNGTYLNVAAGMTWAVDNGAKVLSLSLSGSSPSNTLLNAVNYAWNNGVVVVAAAGNSNSSTPEYPAWYSNCIAVGSTDSNDQRSSFSNFGNDWVDVAAPGSSILSTYIGSTYATSSGTSMATPLVAGLAGLLYSYMGINTSPSAIRAQIENNCVNVGNWVAYGRIDASASLSTAGTRQDFSPSSTTISSGTAVSGSISDMATSNNVRYEIQSTTSGIPRLIDWYASAHVSWSGTLQAVEVRYKGNLTTGGSVQVYLYNFSSSTWVSLGNMALNSTDVIRTFVRTTNPNHFISGSGEMRFRMVRSTTAWTLFRMRTDQIQFTTVAQ
jgi:thermitase